MYLSALPVQPAKPSTRTRPKPVPIDAGTGSHGYGYGLRWDTRGLPVTILRYYG
jgi:hypothetical protein